MERVGEEGQPICLDSLRDDLGGDPPSHGPAAVVKKGLLEIVHAFPEDRCKILRTSPGSIQLFGCDSNPVFSCLFPVPLFSLDIRLQLVRGYRFLRFQGHYQCTSWSPQTGT